MKIDGGPWAISTSRGRSSAPVRAIRRLASASPVVPQYPFDPAWADDQKQLEDDLFAAVNADRRTNGMVPYLRDPLLDALARWAAEQRAWAQYLDHIDHIPAAELGNTTGAQVDRPFGARFLDLGYEAYGGQYAVGENMAYGFNDAGSCEQAFMSDSGHRGNVLGPYLAVGIGVARSNQNHAPGLSPIAAPGLVWMVQDFGNRPVSNVPPVTPPPVTPPPPPPVTKAPAVGTKWVPKVNPTARPVTVVTGPAVTYENRKGNVGHLTVAAFLKRYRPA